MQENARTAFGTCQVLVSFLQCLTPQAQQVFWNGALSGNGVCYGEDAPVRIDYQTMTLPHHGDQKMIQDGEMMGVELCAGAGGQALGLELGGFGHAAAIEIDPDACATLRLNRPQWDVRQRDLREVSGSEWKGVELVAGGFPCPPYSVAGKQLGPADERDLFGYGLKFLRDARPAAALIENVRGILDPRFASVRDGIREGLGKLGYTVDWRLLNASDFGVCQLRPRVIFVAMRADATQHFRWPAPNPFSPPTVGETLLDLMSANGWEGAEAWAEQANDIAPTIVGGSKKHGGPDLGPTRARKAWATLGVNGKSLAWDAPEPGFVGMPRLTVEMVARLQGFPKDWRFHGKKTTAYRQVGNAFPSPVARAVATQIRLALEAAARTRVGPRKTGARRPAVPVAMISADAAPDSKAAANTRRPARSGAL